MTRTAHAKRPRRTWLRRATMVAALVAGGIGVGSVANAVWNPQVSATGSVSAGQVSGTLTGDLASVLTNSAMTTTRAVTLTNTTAGTSTQSARASVALKVASGDTTLTQNARLSVWPTTNPALCTAAAVVGTGNSESTWAAGLTMTTTLARGQSASYCVRTAINREVGSPVGARSFVASADASLSVGTFATTRTASATVSTSQIYPYTIPTNAWYQLKPSGQALCVDVTGGQNAKPGAAVGTYTCHTTVNSIYANQWFAVTDVGGEYAVLRTQLPANTFVQASGTSIAVQSRDVAATTQRWLPQLVAANTYQFVNVSTGTCLTAPAAAGALTISECSGATNQRFTLAQVAVAAPTALARTLDPLAARAASLPGTDAPVAKAAAASPETPAPDSASPEAKEAPAADPSPVHTDVVPGLPDGEETTAPHSEPTRQNTDPGEEPQDD